MSEATKDVIKGWPMFKQMFYVCKNCGGSDVRVYKEADDEKRRFGCADCGKHTRAQDFNTNFSIDEEKKDALDHNPFVHQHPLC